MFVLTLIALSKESFVFDVWKEEKKDKFFVADSIKITRENLKGRIIKYFQW